MTAFDLPADLDAKAAPDLVAADENHFAVIARTLETSVAELSQRLDQVRRAPAGMSTKAFERDQEIHQLTARLRTLRRFGLDLCLGRMVKDDGSAPMYIGRLGLTDAEGHRLLHDWRSPVSEPFFGATHGDPMGLASRRRYRWTRGRITDYWDEVFDPEAFEGNAALDDQSAFIASLGTTRSPRMRDVLGTIQADQDAIIRAGSKGALVVDGGPGTGKTVVALHRTAYLLYADPRLEHRRGGVLFVGPHQPYLDYVGDVLPSLGEEGVRTCTLRDLLPEGAKARPEADPEVARLKSTTDVIKVIDAAIRFYVTPPAQGMEIATPWADALWLSKDDWAAALGSLSPGTPHNEAPDLVLDELVTLLADKHDEDAAVDPDALRRVLQRNQELMATLNQAWPMLEPTDLVADLWSVPAYLRRCAPWLEREQIRLLQRKDAQAWTVEDLPFLDAARQRLGDPATVRHRRRYEAAVQVQRERRADVTFEILDSVDDAGNPLIMLKGSDLQDALIDDSVLPGSERDDLAGPFAHIVVDEAQELTDAEWQMLLLRNPSRSFTIVGDRAQARHGFDGSWSQRLARIGLDRVEIASLSINYRTPEEVMAEAEPVIRAVLPDANVPTSIRSSGLPVIHGDAGDLPDILEAWLAEHHEGVACVIGDHRFKPRPRVRSLTPTLAKGLEFDLVVLVDPDNFGEGVQGAVDRYVAMTRATRQLVMLS